MISVHINQLIAVSKSTLGREEGREKGGRKGGREKGERERERREEGRYVYTHVIKYTGTTLYKNE